MKSWRRWTLAVAVLTTAGIGLARMPGVVAQNAPPSAPAGKKAGEVFKNVTTSTLKDLSVDDFLGAMGVMNAALGYDCADCHTGAGGDHADFVTDEIPQKKTARKMVEMVAAINKTHFAGTTAVTCWTCHHQQERPSTSIALDNLYGPANIEDLDILIPAISGPSAEEILDKYVAAVGGAQRLATLTSYIATGVSNGYGGFGGEADFSIYAKAPNQRTTVISFKNHPDRGVSSWVFNGTTGWIGVPRGLLGQYELLGEELDGARLEAQIGFPGNIKQVLNNWQHGLNRAINGKDYDIVQGRGPRGLLATFYFDPQTSLLRRLVRYGPSPVGRVSVQVDYTDYRDIGGGIKLPFELQFSWLDGRYTAKIKEIKTNVAIEDAKFGNPSGGSAASAGQSAAQQPKAEDKAGPNIKQIAEDACSGCHSFEPVAEKRLSRQEWADLVQSMIDRGAYLTKEQIPQVIDYLFKTYPNK